MGYPIVPARRKARAVLGLLLCLAAPRSFAQEAARDRGDYLTLKIAVMGPGDELYFWWGHIALIIEDGLSGQSRFYDYGLFSFENEHFFVNFAFGRLLYSCGASPTDRNIAAYRQTNRDVTIYTLDLPAPVKENIRALAEKDVLPENRNYYYHHFRDNCSTRIRDLLDAGLDGQLQAAWGNAPGRFTLRQHVRRHTWFSPFFDWILNFWMGQGIDAPITVWDEMFLPQEVGRRIEDFYYTDHYREPPEGQTGRLKKLVSQVETLNRAVDRPPVLAAPRNQWSRHLGLGLGIAGLCWLFHGIRRKRDRIGRLCLGVIQSCLGLFFGAAGSVLCFMILFTNHDYTYHNSNLLYVNPLLLAALPLGIRMIQKNRAEGRRAERLLGFLWLLVFLGGLISMAVKVLPWFYQQNQATQALVLPFALSLGIIPLLSRREAPRPPMATT
ncbi:MAG: DUF4105 domain-containing protein [Treponema sp.]|nr:DUF4105 domain-containing protein [Treponema sp.]